MLNFIKSDKGEPNFSMTVSTSRKIDIYWSDIESELKSNHQCKQIVFIDPIVLSFFPELVNLESSLPYLAIVPTNIGEKEKDINTLLSILSVLEQEGVGRRSDKIYVVGGGVLIDVVSLACSVFRRGIYLMKVPTTLLAFIDASIGIKSGINFMGQRNRLGTYNSRFNVLLDPKFLKILDKALIQEGLGEIFKIALIKSEELFDKIEKSASKLLQGDFYNKAQGKLILSQSLRLMLEEIHKNPEEDILRRSVDFGHTFSPLVEMESVNNASYRKLPHGYAVAYDCLLSSVISNIRGKLSDSDLSRIFNLYLIFDFDLSNSIYMDHDLMWASVLEMTKHRGNNQHIPVPTGIGQFCFIEDLTYDELKIATKRLANLL
jgi:2-epi-5-epi-valiolone synthase